jgi:hypothetical protein
MVGRWRDGGPTTTTPLQACGPGEALLSGALDVTAGRLGRIDRIGRIRAHAPDRVGATSRYARDEHQDGNP